MRVQVHPDEASRSVGQPKGALEVHLAHRPGRPDEDCNAAGQQVRPVARLAI